ncbi:MAG: bifunctional tetrahydrofolate synthase/dihydrofolate synthase [Pseudomonadota bacterium]
MTSRFSTLNEWLTWLERRRGTGIDLGLERCRRAARALGLKKPAPCVVTVAGTNGKGSSVAMLEAILRAAGFKTASYTSPHLVRYNERIKIGGIPVSDDLICDAFERVEQGRDEQPLTYFEFATLAALTIFAASDLDIVVLEVGLGGRLDAVNIIDPDIALITSIGLDHTDWLGETREAIGYEKAGIMRARTPAICSDAEAPQSVIAYAREIGAELELLGVDYWFEVEGDRWNWWSKQAARRDLSPPPLQGFHQFRNASGVLAALAHLPGELQVSQSAIEQGLQVLELHGRFEQASGRVDRVLDVAHNPQALGVFLQTLAEQPPAQKTHIVIGMLAGKDHNAVLSMLREIADCWYLVDLPADHAESADKLAERLQKIDRKADWQTFSSAQTGYETAMAKAQAGDRIVVIGSFVTVGEVMKVDLAGRDTSPVFLNEAV